VAVLFSLPLLFAPNMVSAETIFKCKGADGAMHYQGSKCAQTDEVSHWAPKEFTAIPYKTASIVIPIDGSMAYRVNGSIEGTAVSMQVDTGASSVAIPKSLADKLKLTLGQPQQFSTANGLTTGYKTIIHTLKIGDFTLTDVEAAVMSNLPGGVLLGQTALGRLKVEQAKGELRISAL
jgi:clan AA aspartic protease (TIGR02281 family)